MIFVLAAALSAQFDACSAAIHGDLPSTVQICDPGGAKIDVMEADGMTDACLSALKAGKQLGQIGPKLPDVARNSLVARFDKSMDACRHPVKRAQAPDRKITNLWRVCGKICGPGAIDQSRSFARHN